MAECQVDVSVIASNGQPIGPFSFFGVFDGHGGRSAAIFCRDNMPNVLFDEVKKQSEIERALHAAFLRTDEMFIKGDGVRPVDNGAASAGHAAVASQRPSNSSGTTASTLLIDHRTRRLWAANAGDSRVVLCRAGQALSLTKDHKADRPDEIDRIRKAGGMVRAFA